MGWHENQYAAPNDQWCTPPEVLEPIYEHFGEIGLDPCSDTREPHTVWAKQHYWRRWNRGGDNGLSESWDNHGLVYVNPPFSNVAPWAEKAAKEGDEVILLVPCRTGAVWWQTWVAPADVILFWKGRLTFVGAKNTAPFHCALVYWGTRPELLLKAFPGHWYVRNGG